MGKTDIVKDRIRELLVTRPGISQAKIAADLGMTPQTVSKYVKAIRLEWQAGDVK